MNCNTTHYRANSSSVPGDPRNAAEPAHEAEGDGGAAFRPGDLDALGAFSKAHPDDGRAFYHLALLHTLVRREDDGSTASLDAVREALRLEPDRLPYLYLQALASVRPASMSPEREENEKRRILERILEKDPGHVEAALALARYYSSTLSIFEKAESFVDRALQSNENSPDARLMKVDALRRKGFDVQADEALARLAADPVAKTHPEVRLDLARQAEARHDRQKAREILEGLLADDVLHGGARRELRKVQTSVGDLPAVLAVLDAAVVANPYDVAARLEKSEILESLDRLEDAATTVEEAIRISRDNAECLKRLGMIRHRQGKTDAALTQFDAAAAIDPNDRDLQRYIEFLNAAERPFQDAFPVDRAALLARARAEGALSNEAFVTVIHRTLIKVNRDATTSRYVYFMAKVQSEEGARQLGRIPVPFAAGEERVRVLLNKVIRKDGTEREGRTHARDASVERDALEFSVSAARWIDIPPLETGDVVEVAYRVDDVKTSFFGDYFGLSHSFRQGGNWTRVLESELILVFPEDRSLLIRSINGAPEPEVGPGDEPGSTSRRFVVKDLPFLSAEPYMPRVDEIAPMVEATTYRDWGEFASWWWNLVRRELQMSDEMRGLEAKLVQGARTDEEKIEAVYDFVVSQVRYNAWEFGVHGYQPYNAGTICARRFGDCKDKAILLVTFLRDLGIDAWPVLIRGEEPRSRDDLTLPLVDHFNHCIAYVEPHGGSPRFLDGTAEFHDARTVPDMDRGAKVLIVRDGRADIGTVPQPAPAENRRDVSYEISIGTDRSGVLTATVSARGTPAANERWLLDNPGRRREILESRFIRDFGAARLLRASVPDLSDLRNDVSYTVSVEIPEMMRQTGEGLSLPAVFDKSGLEDYATLETRRFDLLLPTPHSRREVIEYRLPPGFKAQSLPTPARLETPFGSFVREVSEAESSVRISRELSLSATRVSAADYPAFREFALAVYRAEEQIVSVRESR